METNISQLRLKEISDITGIAASNLNRWFRQNDSVVTKGGKKITGVSHSAVESLFRSKGQDDLYRGGIYIWNSQTGGSAKTSSVMSTSHAYARISDREKSPIVLLDTDSQSSLSLQLMGELEESIPVLADYLEGRASLKEMLKPLGNNVFLIPSSLDNAYLEKIVSTPKKVKESGLKIFEEIFELFGERTKVFVDTPPALSGMTHSLLLGANNLSREIERVLCIPIRCDSFALKGAEIAVSEFEGLLSTYNVERKVDCIPYMVMYDQRTNNSITAMKALLENPVLNKYEICPIVIRASAEASKAINKSQNIYTEGKLSALGKDYMDFMLSIMGWSLI